MARPTQLRFPHPCIPRQTRDITISTYPEEIEAALDRVDPATIERAGQALLMEENRLFLPIGGMHDLARDAEILKLQDEVHHRYVAISVEKGWDRKILKDVTRVKAKGFKVEEVLYCTPKKVPEGKELAAVRQRLRDEGAELKIADRKWWINKLQQDSPVVRRVKREELHLAPFRPSPLRTPDEYEEYLSGKRLYVLTELIGREALIHKVAEALKPGVALVLHGNLGSGKTRVAVEAAKRVNALVVEAGASDDPELLDALLSGPERTVALDDAHIRIPLVQRFAMSHLDPAIRRPPTLLLVAWSSTVERVRAAVSDAYQVVAIEVLPLDREELATILREQFYLDDADRAAILTQSQGLPLFAILGALALGGGASREEVARENPLEAWFERAWPRQVPDGDAELLGIIAMRGSIQLVDRESRFTIEAQNAAAAAGLRPQVLRGHLEPYLDSGLLGYEDDRYVITPDALAQLVLKKLCFSTPPLVASPRALVEAAVTHPQAFGRVAQLFDRIAEELVHEAPRRLLIGLVDESLPEPEAEMASWNSFLQYAQDIAPFAPQKAMAHARSALAATPSPSSRPSLREVHQPESLRRSVRELANAALYGGTTADFRAAVTLLLDIASDEPLVLDLTGMSQSRAPAMHDLLKLSGRFNPRGEPTLPYAIRGEMFVALRDWWKNEPEKRADRVLLLLTRLLDPSVFASYLDADRPHQVTLSAGFLDARGYSHYSGEVIDLIEEVMAMATSEGGRSVLSQVDDIVGIARGFPGAFNATPPTELQALAKEVACRVLAATAKRFGANPGFMVRIHEMELHCGCPESPPVSADEQHMRALFTWEHSEDYERVQRERFESLTELAASLNGLPTSEIARWLSERARMAQDAGLDVQTIFARRFVEILGKRRPAEAAALADLLIADPSSVVFAELPLMDLEATWDKGARELLEEWLTGPDYQRFALWSLLSRVPSDKMADMERELLLKALAGVKDSDARLVEIILIRVAGGPEAPHVLGAALRSPSQTVRRVAAIMSCLRGQQHAHHIPLPAAEDAAFETAFLETAVRKSDDRTDGMLEAAKETLSEVIDLKPDLAEQWLRRRLHELGADRGHYVETLSHGETEALHLARGKIDGAVLLDDYTDLDDASYFQREGYKKILRTLVVDLPTAVAKRFERGNLNEGKTRRLVRLVPEGPGWPALIVAASRYMSEDDLLSAVYSATFHSGIISGSRIPVAERQHAFFEELAGDGNKLVARVGRKLAEHYRREVERTRKEEFREQYER